jgi:glutamate synthase (NADPH/NADH) small chain
MEIVAARLGSICPLAPGDEDVGPVISAAGRRVVVLGGGDTGSDCVGTSHRQGAASVTQIELLPRPPDARTSEMPWPFWPLVLRTSSSHEEGGARDFSILTKRFTGDGAGRVAGLEAVRLYWHARDGREVMEEAEGSELVVEADLVLLALGFLGPETEGPIAELGVALDARGNVAADTETFRTSLDGVFACGDLRRGQSLVVWAIWEGRQAARSVDRWLMGETRLPASPLADSV